MRCRYCKCALVTDDPLSDFYATREHRQPKSKGGNNGSNVVWACARCNNEKGDMTEAEFAKYLKVTDGIEWAYRRRAAWKQHLKGE